MTRTRDGALLWGGWRGRAVAGLVVAVVAAGLTLVEGASPAAAAADCSAGSVLNVVAHQDDDLLFINPDIVADLDAGKCVRTVFLTAGDAGYDETYWEGREQGARSAYAQMAGVSDSWALTDAAIPGHPARLQTLNGQQKVSLVFLRLPDGGLSGTGYPVTGNVSLAEVWDGDASSITAIDGSGTSYTRTGLISALTTLMQNAGATEIDALDAAGAIGDGDHPDHYASAYFAQAAHQSYGPEHVFRSYRGYPMASEEPNVSGAALTAKVGAYEAYSPHDSGVCQTLEECGDTQYGKWLHRRYVAFVEGGTPPTTTTAPPVTTTTVPPTTTTTTTTAPPPTTTTVPPTTTTAPPPTTTTVPPTTTTPPASSPPAMSPADQARLTAFFNWVVWMRFIQFVKFVQWLQSLQKHKKRR